LTDTDKLNSTGKYTTQKPEYSKTKLSLLSTLVQSPLTTLSQKTRETQSEQDEVDGMIPRVP